MARLTDAVVRCRMCLSWAQCRRKKGKSKLHRTRYSGLLYFLLLVVLHFALKALAMLQRLVTMQEIPIKSWRPTDFVWSKAFALQADVWISSREDSLFSDRLGRDIKDVRIDQKADGRPLLIYVRTTELDYFASSLCKDLASESWILLTGDSVLTVPDEIDSEKVLACSGLQKWFAQNLNGNVPSIVKPLPLGLDFHSGAMQSLLFNGGGRPSWQTIFGIHGWSLRVPPKSRNYS